ncbi:hypothetical protein A4X09_0g806 [Tilletia walkeri]|uniref:Uncharacterized protein n=1 Tax=Tilletia walkeri TaxID=117179 RepID=A0A8X7T789_9BASI|nr:hypothetical protein A4X09_0g806 [Tilletia walkeri]
MSKRARAQPDFLPRNIHLRLPSPASKIMSDPNIPMDEQDMLIADEVMRASFAHGDAPAAAANAYDDDDDALLQAAINASLADQDRVPTSGKRSSSEASARQQRSDIAGSSTSQRKESRSSSSARAAASGPIRNKKSRSANRPESGPSTPSPILASSSAVPHGSPRRRHRVSAAHDHETSTARLSGWNNSGIRMNSETGRAHTPPTGPTAAASSSSRGGTAPSAPSMRNRALSSMSVDEDGGNAATSQRASSTNTIAESFLPDEQAFDNELEALMSGPSGARARRRSQAQNGGGRRSFGAGSGSGTPMSASYERNGGASARRSSEHRSPLLGAYSNAATTGTGDDSVEFIGAYSAPNARSGPSFAQASRSVDSDVELLPESYGSGSARRSPFLHPALRSANLDDIPQDDDDGDLQLGEGMLSGTNARAAQNADDDDDEDDFEVTGSHRAGPMAEHLARLGPGTALQHALAMGRQLAHQAGNVEGDLDEDFDEDGDPAAAAMAHMRAMQSYMNAGGAHVPRNYDDEDEALQAALAASLADAEDAIGGNAPSRPARGFDQSTSSLPDGYDPDAFEAQATAAAVAAAMRSATPPPQDVERIARMREEARRKEHEERDRAERRARGEDVPSLPAALSPRKTGKGDDDSSSSSDDDDDDDDEDQEEEQKAEDEPEEVLTAEEIRRRRLARFNA